MPTYTIHALLYTIVTLAYNKPHDYPTIFLTRPW